MAAERLYIIPIALGGVCAALTCREAYARVYYTQHYLDKGRGVRHDGPGVNLLHMRMVGVSAAAITFAATTAAFTSALQSILLSPRPSHDKLFDVIHRNELPPPLTLAHFWELFGPATAQPNAFSVFAKTYGGRTFCLATAIGWGVFFAPIAHARAETAYAESVAPPLKSAWGQAERDAALQKEAMLLGYDLGESKRAAAATAAEAAAAAKPPLHSDNVEVRQGGAAAALGAAPGTIFVK